VTTFCETINLEEKKPFYGQICFHFQQAAEKYLKAYIIAMGLEFRKIHDLLLLLKQCSSKDPSFNNFSEDCEYLSTFYIETRYPVHWPAQLTKKETDKAYQAADNIRIFIKRKLGFL
jgi:HEPN domain-containing protein